MDDGDILRPRPPKSSPKSSPTPDVTDLIVSDVSDVSVSDTSGATVDFNYVRSMSKPEKERFCLSRRAQVPASFAREKLAEFFDDFDDESVAVLLMMAKCFVAKTIERAKIKKTEEVPISVSELLEARNVKSSIGI